MGARGGGLPLPPAGPNPFPMIVQFHAYERDENRPASGSHPQGWGPELATHLA